MANFTLPPNNYNLSENPSPIQLNYFHPPNFQWNSPIKKWSLTNCNILACWICHINNHSFIYKIILLFIFYVHAVVLFIFYSAVFAIRLGKFSAWTGRHLGLHNIYIIRYVITHFLFNFDCFTVVRSRRAHGCFGRDFFEKGGRWAFTWAWAFIYNLVSGHLCYDR